MASNKIKNASQRNCKLTDDLSKEFPFINKTKIDGNVNCEICFGNFSISSGGRRDINRHLMSDKHKKCLQAASSSTSLKVFFRQTSFGKKEKELAVAEALFSFHTVFHNQSFRSMDCTSKLIQKMFEKQFSCARAKTEAIVKKVIAQFALEQLKNELQTINFVSIFSDASNHKDIKLFPTLIRYFNTKTGVQIKVLDFVSLPRETSEVISNSILEILEKNELCKKLIAYCADNANTNFGGVARKGTKNIFKQLNSRLSQEIIGVGCASHIVHNAILTAADLLPVDIENVVVKIYGHFFIYTVRVESLKEFREEADVEYHRILGYSKTRWLALMPAVERIIKLFSALRSYFLSLEKCPTIIESFFNNKCAELWLKFIHSQASIFHTVVKNIEGNTDTIMKVSEQLNMLRTKYQERLQEEYIPIGIRFDLRVLEENGDINKKWFIFHVKNFYSNSLQYLELWTAQFNDIDKFIWINLNKSFSWAEVQISLEYIMNNLRENHTIDENDLFDEVTYAKRFASDALIKEWTEKDIPSDKRWVEMFSHFDKENIPSNNIKKIVEFGLCLPGTNAVTERVFSLVNKIWTNEKTQLSVETIKSMIIIKYNLVNSCDQFLDKYLSNNDYLLKKVHSAEKYL